MNGHHKYVHAPTPSFPTSRFADLGKVAKMGDEYKRAWHAGCSYWRGITDVNSASIGIEIVNPGHEWGYRPFPEEQIAALIPLMHGIVRRHRITRGNIV